MRKTQNVTIDLNEEGKKPITVNTTQSAQYDKADDWLHVVHDGQELSLSRENFTKLCKLVNDTCVETVNQAEAAE